VYLPAPLGVRDARVLAAQPVRGVLLAVLVAGYDFQPVLIEIAGLGQLDRLAQHPGTPGPPIRHVPDRAQRARCPQIACPDHAGCIVEQDPEGRRSRPWGRQRQQAGAETKARGRGGGVFEHVAPGY